MKWHQAHTTWFFATFVLCPFLPDYEPLCDEFRWLFNSYYNSLGEEAPKKHLRAAFSRPSLDEVIAFRMDHAVEKVLAGRIRAVLSSVHRAHGCFRPAVVGRR